MLPSLSDADHTNLASKRLRCQKIVLLTPETPLDDFDDINLNIDSSSISRATSKSKIKAFLFKLITPGRDHRALKLA